MPDNAIETEAAIDIAAPPEQVANVYRNVGRWGEMFPAAIEYAYVLAPLKTAAEKRAS